MADYRKPDYWQLKARKEGYPARSVYKLDEMNGKFRLLPDVLASGKGPVRILDLGAAPGSWSLYVLRKMRANDFLVSVDLSPLSRQYDKGLFDKENFFFIQGDFTDDTVRREILSRGPYALLLSDAAPATSGNRSIDTSRSLELAGTVISYAESSLKRGGSLVIKVFQGGDTTSILKRMKDLFTNAKSYKPEACRSESFETYYVGVGKK